MDERFQYQALPPSDGLRILYLEASNEFASELVGTLSSVPFSARPAYVALSYTWQDRDAKHAAIPLPSSLLASGKPFLRLKKDGDGGGAPGVPLPIGHNLALALLHLRSRDGPPLPLWIDQICINQDDIAERASQVALMSFIYQRTRLVVCWLGISDWGPLRHEEPDYYYKSFEAIEKMHREARVKGLNASLDIGPSSSDLIRRQGDRLSLQDPEFYYRPERYAVDPRNPYWQRIWIVQEVCLAPRVAYMEGPFVCSERQLLSASRQTPTRPPELGAGAEKDWVGTLIEARAGRFSQAMRLEALVERFRWSGCSEMRDKLFALVGLANDAWAVAATSGGEASENGVTKDLTECPKPERDDKALSIDYERPFFDVWCDAVIFVLRQASPMTDFGKLEHEMQDERRAKIVRFAGILQQAFAGKVHEDMASISETEIYSKGYIIAKGYIASKILHLGPTYDEYIGSHWNHSQWLQSWPRFYPEPGDLEQLREMEEQFSNKIINMYTDADVARVKALEDMASCCFAFSVLAAGTYNPDEVVENATGETSPKPLLSLQGTCRPPRRFLGSDRCMGMVPGEAQVGDLIVRFWNCDAAVVVRTSDFRVPHYPDFGQPGQNKRIPRVDMVADRNQFTHKIIGRADVAELKSRIPHDPKAKDKMEVYGGDFRDGRYVASGQSPPRTDAVYVSMDLRTLQKVSEAIVIKE
ncbi:hypothetical protein RB595_009368 [Gaeumannomyces hyphopodioides]